MRLMAFMGVLVATVGVGCNEHGLTPLDQSVIGAEQADVVKTRRQPVDILWVVDNSGSMCEEQKSLRDNFDLFVEELVRSNVDFHLAVVTTDLRDPQNSGLFQNVANGAQGPKCLLSIDVSECPGVDGEEAPPLVIRSSDPRYQDGEGRPDVGAIKRDFGCRATVGSTGDGVEQGLEAARRALGPALTSGHNQGFLRNDAYLALIFLSDENDCSTFDPAFMGINGHNCEWHPDKLYDVAEYAAFFTDLKRDEAGVSRADRVIMAGIIGPDTGRRFAPPAAVEPSCYPDGADPDDPNAGAFAGYRYEALIESFRHSGTASICETPFETALRVISRVIPEATLPCLEVAPLSCETDADCPGEPCEVRGRVKVCQSAVVQVEVEREASVGAIEDRRCDHLPGGRMRCVLLEGEDYEVDWSSSCEPSGVGLDLLVGLDPDDAIIARYPRAVR